MKRHYDIHPIAQLLPEMDEGELRLLAESIQKMGQLDPIVLLDDQILDGRSRQAACERLGIGPIFRNFDPARDGQSPTAFVIAKNVNRRHLTTGQRAIVIQASLEYFEREAEERQKATQIQAGQAPTKQAAKKAAGRAVDQAAEAAGVSAQSVQRAQELTEKAPDLAEKVKAGEISLNAATEELEQREAEKAAQQTDERQQVIQENQKMLELALGEDFVKAMRDGVVLKEQEDLEAFVGIAADQQKAVKELLVRKWRLAKALKFIQAEPTREEKVSELILRVLSAGGKKGTWVIDGWSVTLSRSRQSVAE